MTTRIVLDNQKAKLDFLRTRKLILNYALSTRDKDGYVVGSIHKNVNNHLGKRVGTCRQQACFGGTTILEID